MCVCSLNTVQSGLCTQHAIESIAHSLASFDDACENKGTKVEIYQNQIRKFNKINQDLCKSYLLGEHSDQLEASPVKWPS